MKTSLRLLDGVGSAQPGESSRASMADKAASLFSAGTSSEETATVPLDALTEKSRMCTGEGRTYRRVIRVPEDAKASTHDAPVRDAICDERAVFRAGFVVFTETAEELVIAKQPHIVEEVVLTREVATRTEVVSDTVRRTQVEVQPLLSQTAPTTGATLGRADLLA